MTSISYDEKAYNATQISSDDAFFDANTSRSSSIETIKHRFHRKKRSSDESRIYVPPNFFFAPSMLQNKMSLAVFVLSFFAFLGLSIYAFLTGDPARYIYGADSWGNVCGRRSNPAIEDALLPGLDHSQRPLSFYFITNDLRIPFDPKIVENQQYAAICVSACVSVLTDCKDLLIREGYNLNMGLVQQRICTMIGDFILPHQLYYGSCVPAPLNQVGI